MTRDTINVALWSDVHKKIKVRAAAHKQSINEYLNEQITDLPEEFL